MFDFQIYYKSEGFKIHAGGWKQVSHSYNIYNKHPGPQAAQENKRAWVPV